MRTQSKKKSLAGLETGEWGLLLLALVLSAVIVGVSARQGHADFTATVALIPLFAAIRICRPVAAWMCGFVWGATLAAVVAAGLGTGGVSGIRSFFVLAFGPAAYAFLGSKLTRRMGFTPFVLGVGWMLLTFVSTLLRAEPHAAAAPYSQGVFHGIAQALGYALVSFVAACINGMFVAVLCAACTPLAAARLPARARPWQRPFAPQTHFIALVFWFRAGLPRAPP